MTRKFSKRRLNHNTTSPFIRARQKISLGIVFLVALRAYIYHFRCCLVVSYLFLYFSYRSLICKSNMSRRKAVAGADEVATVDRDLAFCSVSVLCLASYLAPEITFLFSQKVINLSPTTLVLCLASNLAPEIFPQKVVNLSPTRLFGFIIWCLCCVQHPSSPHKSTFLFS